VAGVLIATAVPGVALASQAGVGIVQTSETLTAGGTGTFDFSCQFDQVQPIAPVTWTLLDPYVDQEIAEGTGTVSSTADGMERDGSLTLPLTTIAAGPYRLRIDCLRVEDTAISNLFGLTVVEAAPADVATTTTLTATPQNVFGTGTSTLVARVPGASGTVRLFVNGADTGLDYWLNSEGEAVIPVIPINSTTYRVRYNGTEGYLPSTSADELVTVDQPGQPRLSGTVEDTARIGRTLTVDPGTWPAGTTFTYRWSRDYLPMESATGASYTPTVADLGTRIGADVLATVPGVLDAYPVSTTSVRVQAQPTVTVGSRTITSGGTAVVPITVTGPAGAPAPTGDVVVTVTGSTAEQVVTLDGGTGSATFANLAAGTYTVTAAYPGDGLHDYARGASGGQRYLEAVGTGTITVQNPAPTLTVADTLTVPVATAGVLSARIGAPLPAGYEVREGSTVLVSGTVTGADLSITLPVLAPGAHTLTLTLPTTETTAAVSRTVTVTVVGEPTRTGTLPTADLATPKAATAPGQAMDLVAEGFEPGETVAFYLHSDPVFLGTAVAGADGIARLRATVPADVPVGSHTVIATGGTSGRWAQLSVVLAVPSATPAPALAATGAQTGALMTGAWLLLGLGGGLVLLARRVRAAR
jgi:hypothetical protein